MFRIKHFQAISPEFTSYRGYLYLDRSLWGYRRLLGFVFRFASCHFLAVYSYLTIFNASVSFCLTFCPFFYLSVFRLQACHFVPVPTLSVPICDVFCVYLSVHLSGLFFFCLCVPLPVFPSICRPACLYVCLPVRLLLHIFLTIFLSAFVSADWYIVKKFSDIPIPIRDDLVWLVTSRLGTGMPLTFFSLCTRCIRKQMRRAT
jgi:hypothetical protein